MKQSKILLFLTLLSLITVGFIPNNSFANTVLGESIFPAEQGDEFIWETTNATEPWYDEVDYVRFTVDAIYNFTYNISNYLFLNYSLAYYHRFSWIPRYINSLYMAYNKTLNFLNWSENALQEGFLFLFPTPINFTLIQETIKTNSVFNTSVDGQKLTLDYGNTTIIEHTIESNGIASVIEKVTNGTTIFKLELNEEEIIVKIPFGFGILLFTLSSIIVLVKISKKKIKRYNQT